VTFCQQCGIIFLASRAQGRGAAGARPNAAFLGRRGAAGKAAKRGALAGTDGGVLP